MEKSDRVVLGVTTIVVATLVAFLLLVFVPASWSATPGDEPGTFTNEGGEPRGKAPAKAPEPAAKAPDVTVGDPPLRPAGSAGQDMGPPTKDEAAKQAAEEAAKKAAAEKTELQKQVEDLQKKLQEAEAAKAAIPPPAPPATAKAPAKKRVARKPAAPKARVAIVVKENKDLTIRSLRDQLAKQQRETAVARASASGFRGGIEVAKEFASAARPQITIKNSATGGAGGSATAKAVNKNGKDVSQETSATTPGQPGGDKPEASQDAEGKAKKPDPKAPAKGNGKTAPSVGTAAIEGVPVRFLIPKGMGRLGG